MEREIRIDKLSDEFGRYTLVLKCSECGHERTAGTAYVGTTVWLGFTSRGCRQEDAVFEVWKEAMQFESVSADKGELQQTPPSLFRFLLHFSYPGH
jgi:hypothetical protein